jgi:hypothetical protein
VRAILRNLQEPAQAQPRPARGPHDRRTLVGELLHKLDYRRRTRIWFRSCKAAATIIGATSVALSADGNTAIVGGYFDNNATGAAWVYTRSGGVWAQQGNKLVGTGAVGNAGQAYSVALSGDGNTAIMGGYHRLAVQRSRSRDLARPTASRTSCIVPRAGSPSAQVAT